MAVPQLYNLVRMTTATTGTGTVTLVSAVGGFLSFAGASIPTGTTVRYVIVDPGSAPTAREWGTGVYTSSGTALTRVLGGSSTGSLLNLSGAAQVMISPMAEDFARVGSFTLTANVTSTVVTDATCLTTSVIVPVATTAHAALAIPSMWLTAGPGSFTVTHANNSYTDRIFNYVIR
jgi:hypothetical protein